MDSLPPSPSLMYGRAGVVRWKRIRVRKVEKNAFCLAGYFFVKLLHVLDTGIVYPVVLGSIRKGKSFLNNRAWSFPHTHTSEKNKSGGVCGKKVFRLMCEKHVESQKWTKIDKTRKSSFDFGLRERGASGVKIASIKKTVPPLFRNSQ